MDLEDNNPEIIIVPSSNPSHEQTPVAAASPAASSVPQDEDSLKKQVNEYARRDKWKEAESIFNTHPDMVRISLTDNEDRALHIATRANSITFVKGLVNRMSPQDWEIQNRWGRTAFCVAAESGNRDLVQIMIEKNQNLPLIKSASDGMLPVHLAAIGGHHKMAQDLSSETLLQKMDPNDIKNLFFMTIDNDMFDVATKILDERPDDLAIDNEWGQRALASLVCKPLEKDNRKASWGDGLELLMTIWYELRRQLKSEEILQWGELPTILFNLIESGNIEAMEWLLFINPELLSIKNDSNNGQSILHCAVRHRHLSIVSLIFAIGPPSDILLAVDEKGNNILHLAAYLLEEEEEETSSTLRVITNKMRSEAAWFKEVEKRVPRELRTKKNKEGKTPKNIFYDSHKELSREIKDTAKGIANSGMPVAALVATVAFAAALVVPGEKTNPWFTVFILANAAALFTSSASILSFLSNFTASRFAQREFFVALHPSLILGPMLLLISIATMVIAFAAASFLIFEHTSKWAAYVVASMGVFPILLFFLFQFSMFDTLLWSRFYHLS